MAKGSFRTALKKKNNWIYTITTPLLRILPPKHPKIIEESYFLSGHLTFVKKVIFSTNTETPWRQPSAGGIVEMRKTRCLEGETPCPKSYAYSKWNIKLNSSQWRYSWLSSCQSLPVQTPHCGNVVATTLQKAGVSGKDDAYHVNPITKIKVCSFYESQYMSNLIPIKSSGNEFKMNMS